MPKFAIPAKAGIQAGSGCRIKPGMTALVKLAADPITRCRNLPDAARHPYSTGPLETPFRRRLPTITVAFFKITG
jgi:hypothetical protein